VAEGAWNSKRERENPLVRWLLLSGLQEALGRCAELINSSLQAFFEPKLDSDLYRAAYHLLKAGGKRLRPFLAIQSCLAVGGSEKAALPGALAVELLHNFTLVHDDIMDRDLIRRGVPTVHAKWGVPMAILAGDLLFALSFEALSQAEGLVSSERLEKAYELLARVAVEICEGQSLDMSFEGRLDVSEEEYLSMIEKKTAALFRTSTMLGALLGGGSQEQVEALASYGRSIGLAFQIKDDILGVISEEKVLGKPVGSDLREGKKTIVVIYALEHASSDDRKLLTKVLGSKQCSEEDLKKALEVLSTTGAIEYAYKQARRYVENGLKHLSSLPESRSRRILAELAEFMVTREK